MESKEHLMIFMKTLLTDEVGGCQVISSFPGCLLLETHDPEMLWVPIVRTGFI